MVARMVSTITGDNVFIIHQNSSLLASWWGHRPIPGTWAYVSFVSSIVGNNIFCVRSFNGIRFISNFVTVCPAIPKLYLYIYIYMDANTRTSYDIDRVHDTSISWISVHIMLILSILGNFGILMSVGHPRRWHYDGRQTPQRIMGNGLKTLTSSHFTNFEHPSRLCCRRVS